jgi:hypothetical protein
MAGCVHPPKDDQIIVGLTISALRTVTVDTSEVPWSFGHGSLCDVRAVNAKETRL